jgi:hypothetical protein
MQPLHVINRTRHDNTNIQFDPISSVPAFAATKTAWLSRNLFLIKVEEVFTLL